MSRHRIDAQGLLNLPYSARKFITPVDAYSENLILQRVRDAGHAIEALGDPAAEVVTSLGARGGQVGTRTAAALGKFVRGATHSLGGALAGERHTAEPGTPRALKRGGVSVMAVLIDRLSGVSFLPGDQPQIGVVYAAHPLRRTVYYAAARFHPLLLEDHFWEVVRLLRSLGATEVTVEHVSGSRTRISQRAGAGGPTNPLRPGGDSGDVSRGRETQQAQETSILFHEVLAGHNRPSIPEDAVWFTSERSWQELAEGRQRYGQTTFSFDFRHTNDYGVTSDVTVAAKKLNLSLGGSFEEHQETVWRVQGTFAA